MERSRKTTARVTKSRLDLPEYFTSPFAISMYPHIDEFTEHGQIVIGYMTPSARLPSPPRDATP